jgi:hypothetical protein
MNRHCATAAWAGAAPIKRPSKTGTRIFNGVGPLLFYFLNPAERELQQALRFSLRPGTLNKQAIRPDRIGSSARVRRGILRLRASHLELKFVAL